MAEFEQPIAMAPANAEALVDGESKTASAPGRAGNKEARLDWELLCVLVFLAFFCSFNILTATRYPNVLNDEANLSSPAINYVHGLGFHSHFCEILAMYPFLLVPWLKVFGVSLGSIRSANIVCVTLALGLLWSGTKRTKIIEEARHRLFLLAVLVTDFGMIICYRLGRYDGFGALLLVLLFWATSVQGTRARLALIGLISILMPWAGLQYLPVVFVAGTAAVIVWPRSSWKEVATSFLGVALGSGAFLSIVAFAGRLSSYRKYVNAQRLGASLIQNILEHKPLSFTSTAPRDPSLILLCAAAIVLLVYTMKRRPSSLRGSVLLWASIFVPALSAFLILTAKFPTYYDYFITIPLVVALLSGVERCESRATIRAVYALCASSALLGVGLNVVNYVSNRQARDFSQVERFVSSAVRPEDVAYVDHAAYFSVMAKATDGYSQLPDWDVLPMMTREQRDSITVIIEKPEHVDEVVRSLGGSWAPTGDRFAPKQRSIFEGRHQGFLSLSSPDLVVLRRNSTDR